MKSTEEAYRLVGASLSGGVGGFLAGTQASEIYHLTESVPLSAASIGLTAAESQAVAAVLMFACALLAMHGAQRERQATE